MAFGILYFKNNTAVFRGFEFTFGRKAFIGAKTARVVIKRLGMAITLGHDTPAVHASIH